MSFLLGFLFILAGVFIAVGLITQVELILAQAAGSPKQPFKKAGALLLKLAGFVLLGVLIVKGRPNALILDLVFCVGSFVCSFLLYLLAKRFLVR